MRKSLWLLLAVAALALVAWQYRYTAVVCGAYRCTAFDRWRRVPVEFVRPAAPDPLADYTPDSAGAEAVMRRAYAALLALALLGCEDDGPELYPDVAGVYDYQATVEGGPGGGHYEGVLLVTQPDRRVGEFEASSQIEWVTADGTRTPAIAGSVTSEQLRRDGSIEFSLVGFNGWRHAGTVADGVISGTWIRSATAQSGSFSAVRR